MIDNDKTFIYLRTTQIELDFCMSREGNPFKKLNENLKVQYEIKSGKIPTIVKVNDNCAVVKGYGAALTTFANIKSADFSDANYIVWEEFIIPQEKRKFVKNEADLFFNLYETVNRNREIEGRDPVKVLMLSNSVSLNSPILISLNLVSEIEKMKMQRRSVRTIPERSIRIELIGESEVSECKKDTVLYKLTKGTRFYDQAISNEFSYDSRYNIKRVDLVQYYPVCSYKAIYFYRHKSTSQLYACYSAADCPSYNADTKSLFKRSFWLEFREKMLSGKMIFENFTIKCEVEELITGH